MNKNNRLSLIRASLLGLGLALACMLGAAQAQEKQEITLNLKDADINALISTVSEVTGRNFIVDPRVKAKVTVVSRRPMGADELYRVFLSILQVHGFSAVPAGPVVKIIPDINAKQIAVPTGSPQDSNAGDEIITEIISVQNVAVAQLVPILRPLVPQQGHLAAYPPTNVLIISDRADNIRRMQEIIQRIDLASDDEIEVIRLEHATASEMVRILNTLQQQQDPNQLPTSVVKMAADERTNSILLSGDRGSRLRMRAMIAHLDTPLDSGGDTRVIYLRFAKAKDLVPVLTGISENLEKQEQTGGEAAAARQQQGNRISIQADEASNALVVSAPPKTLRSIEAIVRQLDIRRAQVLIESIIAEIFTDDGKELGVQWAVSDSDGQDASVPAAGTNFNPSSSGANLFGLIGNLIAGASPSVGAGLAVAVGDLSGDTQFAALINALATNTRSNILSTPSLMTLDNQEAEIRVAQNVPFVTGSYTNQGNNAENPFQTIERQDVGLILKVTPQINEGNAIILDIEQEVSNINESAQASDIVTNKRSIKTTVIVDDGDLIALGGLIDDQIRESQQKVPGLGDIPLLGELFKYRTSANSKRNLMLFLRPQIMRDQDALTAFSSRKYNFMRAKQIQEREKGFALMDDDNVPVVPEFETLKLPHPFESMTPSMVED